MLSRMREKEREETNNSLEAERQRQEDAREERERGVTGFSSLNSVVNPTPSRYSKEGKRRLKENGILPPSNDHNAHEGESFNGSLL